MPVKKIVRVKKPVKMADEACCCGSCGGKSKGPGFISVLIVILIVAAVGYFAYQEYHKLSQVPYTVEKKDGVTTVSPGPGLVPTSPPSVSAPTTPPPTQ